MDILTLAKLAHGYCLVCGIQPSDYNDLDPHHITTRGAGGEDSLENIAPLCHACHRQLHQGGIVVDSRELRGDEMDEFLRKRVRESLARNPARR
jgi:hypothetical protein